MICKTKTQMDFFFGITKKDYCANYNTKLRKHVKAILKNASFQGFTKNFFPYSNQSDEFGREIKNKIKAKSNYQMG